MEKRPSEADTVSASQFPRLSRNSKSDYRVDWSQSLFPVLIQINPVYTLTRYFINMVFNFILVPRPTSSKLLLSFKFSD